MTTLPTDGAPTDPIDVPGLRVFASGALDLLPVIEALSAGGAHVIASDRASTRLREALEGFDRVHCLSADLDLTLDAHRLASAVQRLGGCDVFLHHMGGAADDPAADRDGGGHAANAFLRAMRLIHALRPQMRRNRSGLLILTGCPEACARSLRIVLDRAGAFCARTGPVIAQCRSEDLTAILKMRHAALAGGTDRVGFDAEPVALAG